MITIERPSSTPAHAFSAHENANHVLLNSFEQLSGTSQQNSKGLESKRYEGKGKQDPNNGVTVMNMSGLLSSKPTNSDHTSRNFEFILNSLLSFASVSEDNRWTTLITTDPSEYLRLNQLKFNRQQFRVIYLKNKEDVLWVSWDALAAGNSHTVIVQSNLPASLLSEETESNLNSAAKLGNTTGFILNQSIED